MGTLIGSVYNRTHLAIALMESYHKLHVKDRKNSVELKGCTYRKYVG